MLELLLIIRVLNDELTLKKLELNADIDPLNTEAEKFNWASVANVASNDELNSSKFVTFVFNEELVFKKLELKNDIDPLNEDVAAFS